MKIEEGQNSRRVLFVGGCRGGHIIAVDTPLPAKLKIESPIQLRHCGPHDGPFPTRANVEIAADEYVLRFYQGCSPIDHHPDPVPVYVLARKADDFAGVTDRGEPIWAKEKADHG